MRSRRGPVEFRSFVALAVLCLATFAGAPESHAELFRPRVDYQLPASAAATVDVSHQGSRDLLIVNSTTSANGITVMVNDHEGGLDSAGSIPAARLSGYITSGDLNGDGRLDAAVASVRDTVQVLLANGDGTFTSTEYELLGEPNFVAIAEVTGDAFPDLVVTLRHIFRIVVLRNDGMGRFAAWVTLDVLGVPNSVALLNINADGVPDIAVSVSNTTLNLFVSRAYGDYERRTSPMPGFQSHVAAVDTDLDGDEDLVMGHLQGSSVWTLINNGDETFSPPIAASIGGFPSHLAVADFDGNGWPDVAIGVFYAVEILLNTNGTLALAARLPSTGIVNFPHVEDLDANGYPDLIGCNPDVDSVFVWLNANGPPTSVQLEWGNGSPTLRAEIRPNPTQRQFNVIFDLPRHGDARLELWDVQGRRTEARELGSLGAGRHSIILGNGARMAPGIYLVRLVQGDEVVTARACIVE